MPPRRSTARGPSATPVSNESPSKRTNRASTVPDSIAPRRPARGASQQPTASEVKPNNPRLPEVQIQQSYAYGSSKTPILPTQLVARSRMNLREIADTIDAGVAQAQQHLRNHIDEAQANLQSDARSERAERRASRERSRESSVASENVEKGKNQRVAAWASSLDSSQLDEIPEEDSNEPLQPSDDASHKDTDPSSFPSGIFDHSYNYERGLRRPNITIRRQEDSFGQRVKSVANASFEKSRLFISSCSTATAQWMMQLFDACGHAIREIPNSPVVSSLIISAFGVLLASLTGLAFCYAYTNHVCDPLTASPVGLSLQKYCGACVRNPVPTFRFSAGQGDDLSELTAAINQMNNKIRSIESQLTDKIDQQHAAAGKDFDLLRRQHLELSNQVSKFGTGIAGSANDVASPVIPKINFFALNNGAVLEPWYTSPTKQRSLTFLHRTALRLVGSTRYQTRSPHTALEAWQDVGDCWCSSAVPSEQDLMRLGVKTAEVIYPLELVVENYPHAGSLVPSTIPKTIELWADFQHLDTLEWERLGIRQMQGDSPIGPSFGLIGQADYDASDDAPHVQTFALDVNQDVHRYHAQTFVVRVVSNRGADYTCLYRVRLHGVSVTGSGR